MTGTERKHLVMLARRLAYLERRVSESDDILSYDVCEAAALRWAIEKLREVGDG